MKSTEQEETNDDKSNWKSHKWMTRERERRIQKFDRTEHQAKNRDKNIIGREK